MPSKKSGLGKGLEALFADNAADTATRTLPVSELEPNRSQPRRRFDPDALNDLAASIRQYGVIQPIAVRPLPGGGYQIVAGERRWRAARLAALTEVPVVVLELSDAETLEIALVENLQREDLNPMEEAEGYKALSEQFNLTQEQVAEKVGRSRPAVANAMRLLALPEDVRTMVEQGSLSAGHARALLALDDPKAQSMLAKEIAARGMTVRDVERLTSRPASAPRAARALPVYYREVSAALTETLSRAVRVESKKGKGGRLIVEFGDEDELRELAKRLSGCGTGAPEGAEK